MTLEIAQLGQPILRQPAKEIAADEISTDEFQQFIDGMLATVKEAGGIGLAAPQVFSGRRVFVAGVLPPLEEDGAPEMEVFINPTIAAVGDEYGLAWEGCLSFPELNVLVPRYQRIRVDFLNRHGEMKSLDMADMPARVVQHENDHLDGILTLDRAPSTHYIIKASEKEAAQAALEAELSGD